MIPSLNLSGIPLRLSYSLNLGDKIDIKTCNKEQISNCSKQIPPDFACHIFVGMINEITYQKVCESTLGEGILHDHLQISSNIFHLSPLYICFILEINFVKCFIGGHNKVNYSHFFLPFLLKDYKLHLIAYP